MTLSRAHSLGRAMVGLGMAAALAGATCQPAEARVFFGFGFPLFAPYYAPPPFYYPPPVYYPPPPPVVYTPPPADYSGGPAPGGAQMCYARPYSCPMDRPITAGGTCYCLGNGGQRVYGRAS